jgi:hypothetical protein
VVEIMFTLDYQLAPIAATKAQGVDMAAADSASLRYHLFPGDVVVRGKEADFSTRWGWVQILDFALSLKAIETMLEREREARFEFTESSATLEFQLENDGVSVSSTYAPGVLRVPSSEFREQVQRFVQKVVRDLCERFPRLAENGEIRRLRANDTPAVC